MFGRRNKNKQVKKAVAANSQQSTNSTIQAVTKLRETQTNLEKRVNYLRKKAGNQLELAKKSNIAKKKDEALHHLRRKKILDKEIRTIEASVLTLEEQVLRIEGGSAVSDVYDALKLANAAMAKVNKQVDADKLAEMMNDMEELNADQDELHDIMGMKAQDALNDADLLAEFEAMDADMMEEAHFKVAQVPDHSAENGLEDEEDEKLFKQLQRHNTMQLMELETLVAPNKKPVIKKPLTQDEQALADLEAEMLSA